MVNPTLGLYAPRCVESPAKRTLTGEQVKQCLEVLPDRERLIVRLAVYEGMRPGEILGLQCGDIGDGLLRVQRRVYRGVIDDPKAKRSNREVALSDGTFASLGNWLLCLPDSRPEAWLFPSETGSTPLSRDNLWRRNMLAALKKANLAWATFQVMRRTFASLSKEAGVDAKTRADHMGNTC